MANYYEEMQNHTFEARGYRAAHLWGQWLLMFPAESGKFVEGGCKFHLSVHPDDVAEAWNIAVAEMVKDKVPHCAKVALPATAAKFLNPEHRHAGKMITIETDASVSPENYQSLIQRIEDRLDTAGIRSGVEIRGDRKVPGGAFTFYGKGKDKLAQDPYENFSVLSFQELLKAPEWELGERHDILNMQLPMKNDEDKARRVIEILAHHGIKAQMNEDSLFGLTVLVTGPDLAQAVRSQKQQASPAAPATTKPLSRP